MIDEAYPSQYWIRPLSSTEPSAFHTKPPTSRMKIKDLVIVVDAEAFDALQKEFKRLYELSLGRETLYQNVVAERDSLLAKEKKLQPSKNKKQKEQVCITYATNPPTTECADSLKDMCK